MIDKKYISKYTGEQIDDAVTKINALDLNNYYDKSEIDSLYVIENYCASVDMRGANGISISNICNFC